MSASDKQIAANRVNGRKSQGPKDTTLTRTNASKHGLSVASSRRAVKHLLKSVVREICTLRSVGAGERATALGHPVGTGQLVSLPRSPIDFR